MTAFLPSYSSVHRGAGWKSQVATAEYEEARAAAVTFAGRRGDDDVAIICRNTTEAINHLAYRLRLEPDDVVATTVVEHHANLLPWARVATRRYVECDADGTFTVDDVAAVLAIEPRPKLLAITGASNVTGWLPPIDAIIDVAHERDVPVLVDGAQLAPHRPLPATADFVAVQPGDDLRQRFEIEVGRPRPGVEAATEPEIHGIGAIGHRRAEAIPVAGGSEQFGLDRLWGHACV